MQDQTAEDIIRDLLADPVGFGDAGRGNDLLKKYFQGYPLETLRPLLLHSDKDVRCSASFVASELGVGAKPLLNDAVKLIHDEEPHTRFAALEVILVCSTDADAHKFIYVARAMQDHHDGVKRQTMRLVHNATDPQFKAALGECDSENPLDDLHRQGMWRLLQGGNLESVTISKMLQDENQLTRQYGVIAAARLRDMHPDLLVAAQDSADSVISEFAASPPAALRR